LISEVCFRRPDLQGWTAMQSLCMEPVRVELRGSRYSAVWPKPTSSAGLGQLKPMAVGFGGSKHAPGAVAAFEEPLTGRFVELSAADLPCVSSSHPAPPGLPPPPGVPSHGSVFHATSSCRPCAWFWKNGGCQNGQDCLHCHLCQPGAVRESKREKRSLKAQAIAEMKQMQRLQHKRMQLPLFDTTAVQQHPCAQPVWARMGVGHMAVACPVDSDKGLPRSRFQRFSSPRGSECETTTGSSSDSHSNKDCRDSSEESED